jgi:DNA-binding transcriptional ArsR family regulator
MGAERSGAARRTGEDGAVRSAAPKRPERVKKARPERLDELIHQRTRLAILSALATHDRLAFNDLKAITGATDGNLSVHARKLEEAGYVKCTKRFRGRTPLTEYGLTAEGRRELERYLDHMESIISVARGEG